MTPDIRGRQRWEQLRILEVLDQGRWGRAFRAVDGDTGEPRTLTVGTRPGAELQRLEFEQRARVRHPAIPRVIDVGSSPVAIEDLPAGSPFLVTEWLTGTRCDRITGPEPERRITAWIGDLAGALSALHAVGLIHGGVGLRRVVIADHGHAALAGFGLGPALEGVVEAVNQAGTGVSPGAARAPGRLPAAAAAGYAADLAPEAQIGVLEPRSDLYGLGATVVRIVTGRSVSDHAIEGELQRGDLPQLGERSRPLVELVRRMLARDPADRPRSALAVLDEIQELMDLGRQAGGSADSAARRAGSRVAAPAAPVTWPGAVAVVDALAEGLACGAVAAVIGPPAAGAHELVERAIVRHALARGRTQPAVLPAAPIRGMLDHVAAVLGVTPTARSAGAFDARNIADAPVPAASNVRTLDARNTADATVPAASDARTLDARNIADATVPAVSAAGALDAQTSAGDRRPTASIEAALDEHAVTRRPASAPSGGGEIEGETTADKRAAAPSIATAFDRSYAAPWSTAEIDADATAPHPAPLIELAGDPTAPHAASDAVALTQAPDPATPVAGWHDPVALVLARAPDLAAPVAGSHDPVALALARAPDPGSRVAAGAAAWIERVARAARCAAAPVVIDLADDPRAGAVLGALLRAGGATPVIAIVDHAPHGRLFDTLAAGDALAALLDRELGDSRPRTALVRHALPELDDDGVAAVVAAQLAVRPPRTWVHALRVAAGGWPCTVVDLLRSIAGEPQPLAVDWTARTARGLAEWRARQLRAASPGARRVAAAIAAWGGQARIDRALAALRGDGRGAVTLADIAELERAGLARRRADQIAIDRATADAIEAVLGGDAMARIATAALDDALHDGVDDARNDARDDASHDELAGPPAGPLARPDRAQLAPLIERAVLDDRRAALACEVAEYALARGRADRALGVAQRARAVAPARAAGIAALAAAILGDAASADAHAAAAIAAGGDPVQNQLARADIATRAGALDAAEAALAGLRAANPGAPEIAAMSARWLIDQGRYREASACMMGVERWTASSAEAAGLAALHLDDLAGADAAFARAEAAAAARGDVDAQARALALRARVAHRRDQLGLACDRYREAMVQLAALGELRAAAIAEREFGRVLVERGRAGDALPRLAAASRTLAELGETSAWGSAEIERCRALLALGQLADAITTAGALHAAAATARELAGPAQLTAGEARLRFGDRPGAIACGRAALGAGIAIRDREIQLAAYIVLAQAGERPADPAAVAALCSRDDEHDRWTLARGRLALSELATRTEPGPARGDTLAVEAAELARGCAALAIRASQTDRLERAFRGHAVAAQLARRAGCAELAHAEARRARLAHAAWSAAAPPAFRAVIDGDPDLAPLSTSPAAEPRRSEPAPSEPSRALPHPPAVIPAAIDGAPDLAPLSTSPAAEPRRSEPAPSEPSRALSHPPAVIPAAIDGDLDLAPPLVAVMPPRVPALPAPPDADVDACAKPALAEPGPPPAIPVVMEGDPGIVPRGTVLAPAPARTVDPDPASLASGEIAALRRLLALSRRLHSELGVARILDEFIAAAIELGRAERGFVLMRQPGGEFAVAASRNMVGDEPGASAAGPTAGSLSRGLAEHAARTGEPIAMIDAALAAQSALREALAPAAGDGNGPDRRPAPPAASPQPRSVLALPLRQRGVVVGSLYLDRRLSAGGFDTATAGTLGELADSAAIAVDNAQRSHELARAIEDHASRPGASSPEALGDDLRLRPALAATEQAYVRAAMARTGGNQTAAARLLGLSRFGLQKKLRRLTLPGGPRRADEGAGAPEDGAATSDDDPEDGAAEAEAKADDDAGSDDRDRDSAR